MNQVISFLQSIRLRQIATVFLVSTAFFVIQAFGYGTSVQALANNTTLTPETNAYQVPGSNGSINARTETLTDQTEDTGSNLLEKIGEAAENVKEKLNLDEPTPPSTKKFFNQIQDKADDVVGKTVQGTQEGFNDAANNVTGSYSK
jgi:predicted PurR-regulated permease PerM